VIQLSCDLLAFGNFRVTQSKLFDDTVNTTGIIVLILLGVGLAIWGGVAYWRYRCQKRLEELPDIQGDPDGLLDQACNLIGLGISERRILKKVAFAMKLPQPVSILLSPALLCDAAHTWEKTHQFAPSQYWGTRRFEEISKKVFGKTLDELARPERKK
jgi:hypothetical protein